jgi:hypothetical protein
MLAIASLVLPLLLDRLQGSIEGQHNAQRVGLQKSGVRVFHVAARHSQRYYGSQRRSRCQTRSIARLHEREQKRWLGERRCRVKLLALLVGGFRASSLPSISGAVVLCGAAELALSLAATDIQPIERFHHARILARDPVLLNR